jgi:hypothetical protein
MKKFLVVSLILILVSGFVAAQELGVSAEVSGKYDIVNYKAFASSVASEKVDDSFRDTLAGAVPVDGTLKFKGENETAGVEVVLDLGELFFGIEERGKGWDSDNKAAVWFKPFKNDLLTILAGAKPGEGTLWYGDLSSEPNNIIGDVGRLIVEDYIWGFGGSVDAPYALVLTSSPIKDLFIGLGWRSRLGGTKYNADTGKYEDPGYPRLGDNYLALQVGVGYTIENIGSARAQLVAPYPFTYDPGDQEDVDKANKLYNSLFDYYYGEDFFTGVGILGALANPAISGGLLANASKISEYGAKFNSIQAGFKVTALDGIGLNFDIVAIIPLPVTIKSPYSGGEATLTLGAPAKFAVVAEFVTGNISVNGGIGLGLPYQVAKLEANWTGAPDDPEPLENDGIELKFNVEPAIKIGDSVTVGADIAFIVDGYKTGVNQDGAYQFPEAGKPKTKAGTPVDLGLGAFVKYKVGAATLKTGFAVTIPNLGGVDYKDQAVNNDDWSNPVNFRIPLTVTVGF